MTEIGGPFCEEDNTTKAIAKALGRDETALNRAIINALRNLPALRTEQNLGRVREILGRGGIIEKTAVLQLLEDEPALIPDFESELRDLLYGSHGILAAGAGSAVLSGGLFQKAKYIDLGMFDKALQEVVDSDAPRRSLSGSVRISWDILEEWITSREWKLRERGFRCLSVVETDATKVHELLFRCLKTERDNHVITAILNALASYRGAIQAASLAETDQVCRLTKSKFANVRRAAAQALRSFPTIETVSKALIEQYHKREGKYNRETRDVIRAMGRHAVQDKACRAVLGDEINRMLQASSIKWTNRNVACFTELLFAVEQFDMDLGENGAKRLIAIAQDYRSPPQVRRLTMRLYGQTCPMTADSLIAIKTEFESHDKMRRLSAYRAGRRLVQRCRSRVETVEVIAGVLDEVKEALLRCWRREAANVGERREGTALREIRNFLVDIDLTRSAYHEFSESVTVEAL